MGLIFLINSLAGGGAESVLLRLKEYLRPKDIFLLEKDIEYNISEDSVIFLSTHRGKTNSIFKTLYIPIYAFRFSRYIEREDIVLSFLERANFVNVLSRIFKKHRVIVSVHTNISFVYKNFKFLNKILIKTFYSKSDLIVAVSEGVKENLIKLGINREKIRVIYNPCPIKEIQQKSLEPLEEFDVLSDIPYIINVGRLAKPKGQWYLLKIFNEVKREYKDLKLVILGDGELRNYLINLSKNLGLRTFSIWERKNPTSEYDVYLLGFQENPFKFISKAKLFVLTSLWEGFSNVLVEALACGIPVISTDCPSGPREILSIGNSFSYQTEEPEFAEYGILMPVFNDGYRKVNDSLTEEEKVWIKVLKSLLKDEKILNEYGKRAKERAWDFDIERIVGEWSKAIGI